MKSVSGFNSKADNWIRDHDVLLYYTRQPWGTNLQ